VGSVAAALETLLGLPEAQRRLGPFVLVEQLGRGGFAPVWLAREVYGAAELRTVAVKLFAFRGGARARVIDEARALCRVEHPSVVRFYALPIDEARGVMGLAMEHVAGVSLDRRLAARGRLGADEALAVGIALASALAAVHRAGLVHRDVKPANVVEAGGVFKLIDFGIAAAEEEDQEGRRARTELPGLPDVPAGPSRTQAETLVVTAPTADLPLGGVFGTVGYVDPACLAEGQPATAASDLYALGALLFEALAGRLPAAMADGQGLRGEVLDGRARPPSLGEIAPDAPPALARLVDALLSPRRADRPPSAEWVAIQLERVRADLAGAARPLPPESVGPFRGLGRYHEGDRDLYFGRAGDVGAVLEVLRGHGLAAVVGPSGSGKSSLARAGVLPAVADGALGAWPAAWDTVVVEPGPDPRAAFLAALAPLLPGPGAAELDAPALVAALAERAARGGRGLVILVDQLEELCTLASGPGRAWAAALLAQLAAHALPGLRAVVTVRRDLLDPLLGIEGLGGALIPGSVLIEPVGEHTWGVILDRALGAYGYTLEDEALRAAIMAEIARTASAMPLVMFALTELWALRDQVTKRITRRAFTELGGLEGALERHAEATLAELGAEVPGAPRAAQAVLLALSTPEGTRATRSLVEIERAAGPLAAPVIEALERARLVGTSAEGVTLAHEALLTQWGRLRAWVEEAREERVVAAELERDAARWRASPELTPPWRRYRLSFGEDLARRAHPSLSADALAFLHAGRRAERRAQGAVAGAALAVIVAVAGAGAGYVRAVQAKEDATRHALAEEQASRALAERRTREVEEAQRRIEGLVRDLADSPSREAMLELERQLRAGRPGEPAPTPRATPRAPREPAAPPRESAAPREPAAPRESAAPAPPPPPPAAAPRVGVPVEKEW
jgi:serine/threonine protein kinase